MGKESRRDNNHVRFHSELGYRALAEWERWFLGPNLLCYTAPRNHL